MRREPKYYPDPSTAPDEAFRVAAWWYTNFGVRISKLREQELISHETYIRFLNMVYGRDIEMRRLAITLLLKIKEDGRTQMEGSTDCT